MELEKPTAVKLSNGKEAQVYPEAQDCTVETERGRKINLSKEDLLILLEVM